MGIAKGKRQGVGGAPDFGKRLNGRAPDLRIAVCQCACQRTTGVSASRLAQKTPNSGGLPCFAGVIGPSSLECGADSTGPSRPEVR
jgi:hypothetical protein